MSYCDVVCHDCNGDMVCLTCEAQDSTLCNVCSTEITYPRRTARETFDPDAVRRLLRMFQNSFGLPLRLCDAAQAVWDSERKP